MFVFPGKLLFKGFLPINDNFQRPKKQVKISWRSSFNYNASLVFHLSFQGVSEMYSFTVAYMKGVPLSLEGIYEGHPFGQNCYMNPRWSILVQNFVENLPLPPPPPPPGLTSWQVIYPVVKQRYPYWEEDIVSASPPWREQLILLWFSNNHL